MYYSFRCAYICALPQPRPEPHLQSSLNRVSVGVPRDSYCFFPAVGEGEGTSCRSPGGHFLHLTGPACHNLLGKEKG